MHSVTSQISSLVRQNNILHFLLPVLVEENFHVILPFHEDLAPLLDLVPLTEDRGGSLIHLDSSVNPSGVHPGGDIDGVSPDVVVELGGPNDPAGDVSVV